MINILLRLEMSVEVFHRSKKGGGRKGWEQRGFVGGAKAKLCTILSLAMSICVWFILQILFIYLKTSGWSMTRSKCSVEPRSAG